MHADPDPDPLTKCCAGAMAGLINAPGTWAQCLQGSGILTKDHAVCDATV